jgi:hypothetical protein
VEPAAADSQQCSRKAGDNKAQPPLKLNQSSINTIEGHPCGKGVDAQFTPSILSHVHLDKTPFLTPANHLEVSFALMQERLLFLGVTAPEAR